MVVDTSIALKWFAPEPDSDLADTLLGRGLIAPDLLVAELANALWKKRRRRELHDEQVFAALGAIGSAVSMSPFVGLWPMAIEMAIDLDHPIHDCFFLALAVQANLPLVTADIRLMKRCAGTAYGNRLMTLQEAVLES